MVSLSLESPHGAETELVQSTRDQRAQINPTVTPSDNPNYSLQQKPKQKQKVKQTQQQQQ